MLKQGVSMKIEILIRQKREEKGITINKLAELAKMSKGHLSRIERGITEPSIATLARIAKSLDVKVEELYKLNFD